MMNDATDTTQVQQTINMATTSIEAVKGFWKQVLEAQMTTFEAAVGQLEQAAQRQIARAQGSIDETARLTKGALGWLAELQAEAAKTALQALKNAAAGMPKAA